MHSALRQTVVLALVAAAAAKSSKSEAPKASSFAGSAVSFAYPPTGTAVPTSFFPDASEVGFPGPTPTGVEAAAIETAPAEAQLDSIYPLVKPDSSDTKASQFDVTKYWGNLSPAQSIEGPLSDKTSALIPEGYELTQLHLLHRHGARYPTSGSGPAAFAAHLHGIANTTGFTATGAAEFLNTWTYKLGAEILTPFGRGQMYDLGVGMRVQYGSLLEGFTQLPVFRTTSEDRMVDSALNFAAGFFGVRTYQQDYNQLIIIENTGFNNTLAPYDSCNNSNVESIGYISDAYVAQWESIYLKEAAKRLNGLIEGVNITTSFAYDMQQLCAYETVALGYSSFCGLFTEEEWKGFEYSIDLSFWYGNGPGQPTSSAQGIGYVEELLARLTQTLPPDSEHALNITLDGNNITFPVNQPIYVDASHDTVISTILVAMNFTSFIADGPLPATHIPEKQSYIVNQIAPFGTRLIGQVLSQTSSSSSWASAPSSPATAAGKATHIRWLLNDAVLPLTGVGACPENDDGLCPIDTYISGLKQLIAETDFQFACFANFTVPNPDQIVDGQPPKQ